MVYGEEIIRHSVTYSQLSGSDLTAYLIRMLNSERGYDITTNSGKEACRVFRDTPSQCYVALDFEAEMKKEAVTLEFRAGEDIYLVGHERFRCPEALFQRSLTKHVSMDLSYDISWFPKYFNVILLSKEKDSLFSQIPSEVLPLVSHYEYPFPNAQHLGVHQMVHRSISQVDEDLRKELIAKIVITGGGSLFCGLKPRLEKELKKLCDSTWPVKVLDSEKYGTWEGGARLVG